MHMTRRRLVELAAGTLVSGLASPPARSVVGIHGSKPEDVKLANQIVDRLPKHDYVAIMRALADLDKNERWSVPHEPDSKPEPFNRRWIYYANPLLVRIWHEMGYHDINDCESFCGVTLGWALSRDGRTPPPNCAASQNYLNSYGTPVKSPQPGDIAVYTHRKNPKKGHVGIFLANNGDGTLQILGANQLMSTDTTCGVGFTANVIDDRRMTASKNPELYFNAFIRPPSA